MKSAGEGQDANVGQPPPDRSSGGSLRTVVRHAEAVADLRSCFPVISQLRPQLASASDWCERALGMHAAGYRVLACWSGEEVQAVAGYRISENLIHGRFLYIDDLITSAEHRGLRLGARLLDAMTAIATDRQCRRLTLDASARNSGAHRFYAREGLQALIVGFVKPIAHQ